MVPKEMAEKRRSVMPEIVECNRCGAIYDDQESVELVKKWLKDDYAPCPNLSCPGELAVKEVNNG